MTTAGMGIDIRFTSSRFGAVKRACRDHPRVRTREGGDINHANVRTWVDELVDDALEEYKGEDDPLEDVDLDDISTLDDEQREVIAAALEEQE